MIEATHVQRRTVHFPRSSPTAMANALHWFFQTLDRRRTFHLLIVLNALVAVATLWLSRATFLSDGWSYLGLAEGLLHGEYSMWWPLEAEYPDTFRAPGYPAFLAFFIKIFGTWKSVYVVNAVLYAVALYLTLGVIERLDPRLGTRSLFLLLLLPLMNVPYYIGQLYTEIPVLAAFSLVLHLIVGRTRWSIGTAVVLGLTLGFVHLCKPIYLLLPLALIIAAVIKDRRNFDLRGHAVMVVTIFVILLPYGLWNERNHGQFKVTPIEGGGGYMHFAYWCGKMPGYTDHFSLGNFTGDELIRFTPEDSVPGHIAAFEREWAFINAQTHPLLTAKDSIMLNSRDKLPYVAEPTYNTRFAMTRERLLKERAFALMWNDPWYTLAYKSYSAVRLWVIGIQRADFAAASTAKKVEMLYATLSTGLLFLLGIIMIPLAYFRKVISLRNTWPLLLLVVYTGLLHVPFTIQSRYTVCVRFAMLGLLSLACAAIWQRYISASTATGKGDR
ncbi:MAG: glycosyltransferase family 39 protein [Flavobacteriales bacterium]|nr:glycosyltransferase family 39 protein [Flavobacteriales bacterium]